jgi:4-amino-4-deoxychorismate lyase
MTDNSLSQIDRAAAYGDGVFETIAIRDGKARFWATHVARLQTGCLRLGLRAPAVDKLDSLLADELSASAGIIKFATARLVASAPASPRGYRRSENTEPVLSIRIYAARPLSRELLVGGVAARMCTLRLAIQPALAGVKSLNRLEQVLARAEWQDAAIFEGLTLDTDGRLICGTMSNVFIVKDSHLATPGITRCGVSGVMRAELIKRLQENGIACDVRDVYPDELRAADEVFLTNSQFGVVPVKRIDSIEFDVGDVTRSAQQLMVAAGVEECLI